MHTGNIAVVAGQVPLSAEEAQDLQEARQTGVNQDWLMEQSADDRDVSHGHTAGDVQVIVLTFWASYSMRLRSTCCALRPLQSPEIF